MKIKDIEMILLDVPLHPIPQRNMERTNHGWRIIQICRVTTDNGLVGIGETLPNYTWCRCPDTGIERAKGCNPFEIMWDDSLGAGLQMALFDAAGVDAATLARLLGHESAAFTLRTYVHFFERAQAREALTLDQLLGVRDRQGVFFGGTVDNEQDSGVLPN